MMSAVTSGLPSRSPPIQLPGRRNGPTRGGRVPVRPLSAAGPRERPGAPSRARSSARYSRGTTVNSVASKKAIAVRTSSSGVGVTMRRSEVRQRRVISSRSRRRTSRSSDGVSRGSSRRSSRSAQRRNATRVVRRRASVGCAVRTGAIDSLPTRASSSAFDRPIRRSRATASATESSRTPSRAARSRGAAPAPGHAPRRGSRGRSTARMPRSPPRRRRDRVARSSSSSRARSSGSSSRRRAMVRRRMRSTVANSSGPACSEMTWPSRAPSRRTSDGERIARAAGTDPERLGGDGR